MLQPAAKKNSNCQKNRKEIKKETKVRENNIFEIIGKDTKTGIGRDGQQYVIENLVVNFGGKAAKIRAPRNMSVNIGDSARVKLGLVRGYGSAQIGAVVEEIIKKQEEKTND